MKEEVGRVLVGGLVPGRADGGTELRLVDHQTLLDPGDAGDIHNLCP